MNNFYSLGSGSVSSLFSSLNTGSQTTAGLDLSMYASIRSGTYKKLLSAYYAKNGTSAGADSTDSASGTNSLNQQKVNATSVRDSAASVNDAVEALNDSDLWKKDKDGYDTDAIYKSVSAFVKEYNSLVDGTGKSDDNSILRSATNVVNYTKVNKDLLAQIGISVGKDNKLTLDETEFKSSDMVVAKSLFYGAGSYGKGVAGNASMIYGSAVSQLSKLSTTNMYGSDGAYSYISGSTFSRFL